MESKADEKVDEAKKAIIEDRNAAVVKAFEAVKDQFEFDAQKKLWNVKAGG